MTAIWHFGIENAKSLEQVTWEIPIIQFLLMMRQKQLIEDPNHAFTFSDEEFIEKLKRLGY